jgi:hypothetical protein
MVSAKLRERKAELKVALEALTLEEIDQLSYGSEVTFDGVVRAVSENSDLMVGDVLFEVLNRVEPTPTKSDYSDIAITLARGTCYGFCPGYRLTITGDGTVKYEGYNYVRVCGTQIGKIDVDKVVGLVALFEKFDFFAFRDYEEVFYHDSPTYWISLTIDGRTKQVAHYNGDITSPTRLSILENRIDELSGSEKWVGTDRNSIFNDPCLATPEAVSAP